MRYNTAIDELQHPTPKFVKPFLRNLPYLSRTWQNTSTELRARNRIESQTTFDTTRYLAVNEARPKHELLN